MELTRLSVIPHAKTINSWRTVPPATNLLFASYHSALPGFPTCLKGANDVSTQDYELGLEQN